MLVSMAARDAERSKTGMSASVHRSYQQPTELHVVGSMRLYIRAICDPYNAHD